MIKILLNGQPHELENAMTVRDFLDRIGVGGRPVVVELDEQAILPRDYSKVLVEAGARLEIVTLAAGG